jgi:myxalamid-type polyketide synthase MxaB
MTVFRTHADIEGGLDDAQMSPEWKETLLRELLLEKFQPIAIVGVGLRFPGANSTPAAFDEFLRAGGCGTGPIPPDRWEVDKYFSTQPGTKGKTSAAGGGFIDAIDQFDPKFFNFSPKEAQYLDPQHRLALETAWEALEDANIDPTRLKGSTGGVYFGISCFDYTLETGALPDEDLDAYVGTGTAHSAVPGRISYLLGWRGPSIAIDTACSSSIVALDLAVQGLRRGECEIAVCGGVNAIHHPLNHIVFSQAGMLSPDGKCKTFDDAADGYSRSEGCGVVILKRYSDAQRDGDRILALVRGTAVRQDGESGGLTVPNSVAQSAVMRAALENASLAPADIQYVEAHGTGTSLGDPIEMRSIADVFATSHSRQHPVMVGSLKTNVGHMEAAAGIGGVIKTILQLHHARIYPHLNMITPSSHIPWDRYPVRVPLQGSPWHAPVRRALVNSFGFAGTIACAVLEQAPERITAAEPGEPETVSEVFALSAKSAKALRLQVDKYRRFLDGNPKAAIKDICYTAGVGRAHFDERIAGVVADRDELAALLAREPDGAGGDQRKIALMFTGQGSQYVGMGRPLYERYPVFRVHLDECDRLFAPHLGRSIKDLILGVDVAEGKIDQTRFTQPALFAVEFATAKLWMSWGIEPSVLIGHSIGEVVAAAVAGLFSLDDAVALVSARSKLMQSASAPGGMVSVQATVDEVAALIADYQDIALAAVNAPGLCVLSGGQDSLAQIVAELAERGVPTKALRVSHAFHSPLMTEVFEDFAAAIATVQFREPELTMVSNVTGAVAPTELMSTPEYWVHQIGQPVNFTAGMRAIAERGRHVFIEVGPAATLIGLGRRCVDAADHLWFSSMHPDDHAGDVIKRSVAEVYRAGTPISWLDYYRGREGRRLTLPTYAFDRRRCWLPTTRRRSVSRADEHHPLLGTDASTPSQRAEGIREFRAAINPEHPGYLRDHVVMGQVVVPGAAYIEVLLALQDVVFGETIRPLRDVEIHEPLILSGEHDVELRTRLRMRANGGADVEVLSRVAGEGQPIERRHITAEIGVESTCLPALVQCGEDLRAAAALPSPRPHAIDDLYSDFEDLGLTYGSAFQRITALSRAGTDVAVARLRGHDAGALEHLPPFLLDNVIQSVAGVLDDGETYLPVRFGTFQLLKKPKGPTLRSLLRITSADIAARELTADLTLWEGERAVCVLQGLGFKRVTATPSGLRRRLFHQPRWVKRSLVRQPGGGPREFLVVNRTALAFERLAPRLSATNTRVRCASDAAEAGTLLSDWRPSDVCWFWRSAQGPTTKDTLREECERNYRDLLALLADLRRHGFGPGQRLWLVTEGAQQLPGDATGDEGSLAAATLWGFGRSLWSENPFYRATLVDLAPDGDYAPLLEEWLASEADEFQVAYRGGKRHVRRIYDSDAARETDENFELAISERGKFSNIKRTPVPDVAPQGTEVQVQIHAAGLNFKDVLNALGLLKQHSDENNVDYHELPLGFEGAGTVLATGPEAEFQVGDEVVVSHIGCMRKRVVVPSAMAVRKPANIGFAEAAGLPTAYITAYYALHTLAEIKAGDRVLVHAAAGGVGQAAIALAKLAGAEVFATASPAKHSFLRAQGIEHVMNSRTLDFVDEIRRSTGGAGVDVVINSLNKDYIPAGINVLAHGGRFVELGKIGIWTAEQVRRVRGDVTYHNFDLSELPQHELQRVNQRILHTVADMLRDGSIAPIVTTEYSLDEVEEAFGVLSRGANVGKLAISFADGGAIGAQADLTISPEETYLITGGMGALGLITAQKLVDEGARHLSLLSRRAPSADEVSALEARLGHGVHLEFYQGDIANAADVDRIADAISHGAHPLGGIIHAAGVLADGPISTMSWEQIDKVFQAKVYGTWLLHRAARRFADLRFFVGYSSIASVLGPSGQANYAAGNAFVDSLMARRAANGDPALSICWGPWAKVGMVANLTGQMIKGIEGQGLRFLKPKDGARALWRVLGRPVDQVMIGEFEWDRYVAARPASNALYRLVARTSAATERTVDLPALRALPRGERRRVINETIRARVVDLLHFDDVDDISPHAKFMELGVDSLMAVEMKNALEVAFKTSLPTSAVFDYPSVTLLAEFVDLQLVPAVSPDGSVTEKADTIPLLRDEDIDTELAAMRSL